MITRLVHVARSYLVMVWPQAGREWGMWDGVYSRPLSCSYRYRCFAEVLNFIVKWTILMDLNWCFFVFVEQPAWLGNTVAVHDWKSEFFVSQWQLYNLCQVVLAVGLMIPSTVNRMTHNWYNMIGLGEAPRLILCQLLNLAFYWYWAIILPCWQHCLCSASFSWLLCSV